MIIIPLLQKLMPLASTVYKELFTPPSEAEQCRSYFREILSFMNRKGGHLASVRVSSYINESGTESGFTVCIDYNVRGRENRLVPKNDFCNVYTLNWKSMERHLQVLGSKFEQAAKETSKAFNKDSNNPDVVNLMDEFNQYLAVVKENAKKVDAPHHTP